MILSSFSSHPVLAIVVLALIPTSRSDPDKCDLGWKNFGTKCYWYNSDVYNSEHIVQSCQYKHAQPVSVHNPDENKFVRSLITGNERAWLGSSPFKWDWIDKSQFDYHNFSHFEAHTRQCVITIGSQGDWNCTNVGDPFFYHYKIRIGAGGKNGTDDRIKLHTICTRNATETLGGSNPLTSGLSSNKTTGTILALVGAFVVTIIFVYLLVHNHQRIKNAYTNFTI